MTSHAEYIATQDIEQLENLIAVAQSRVTQLKLGGWVQLWVVSDCCNLGWFAEDDYNSAIDFLVQVAKKYAKKSNYQDLAVTQENYRLVEAQRLVASTKASIKKAGQPGDTAD